MRLGNSVPPLGTTVLVWISRCGTERAELATLNTYRNGKTTWLIQNTMIEIKAKPEDEWWNIPSITGEQ